MQPRLVDGGVRALCPECDAVTTFEMRYAGGEFGVIGRDRGGRHGDVFYGRTVYRLLRCAGCSRGGLVTIYDQPTRNVGGGNAPPEALVAFYPGSINRAPLPDGVPVGVEADFREAEICASCDAWRGASALLRSALEKTLGANGYGKGTLAARIDEAAADGVITAARQRRAHDDVRSLGNDILHDEWRPVSYDEYETAHHYVQRVLEDFYDHREEVEKVLADKRRDFQPVAAPAEGDES